MPCHGSPFENGRRPCDSGSFGSSGTDQGNGLGSVFGEVLEAFDGPEAEAPDHGESCIAQGGKGLRGVFRAGAAVVLAAGDIPDIVEPVLDTPVCPNQVEQAGGIAALSGGRLVMAWTTSTLSFPRTTRRRVIRQT